MAGSVVIAIDATSQAEKALNWYFDHIHKNGNRIVIVHTVDFSSSSSSVDGEHTSEATFTIWHQQKQKIKALEDKYRWKLNEKGLTGKIRTESGKPGEKIIQVAKEEKAAMVVIGSRGLSKFKRTFSSSSVSTYVLHHSPCPVVICRIRASTDYNEFSAEERRESTASLNALPSTSSGYASSPTSRRMHMKRLMSEPDAAAVPTIAIENLSIEQNSPTE